MIYYCEWMESKAVICGRVAGDFVYLIAHSSDSVVPLCRKHLKKLPKGSSRTEDEYLTSLVVDS